MVAKLTRHRPPQQIVEAPPHLPPLMRDVVNHMPNVEPDQYDREAARHFESFFNERRRLQSDYKAASAGLEIERQAHDSTKAKLAEKSDAFDRLVGDLAIANTTADQWRTEAAKWKSMLQVYVGGAITSLQALQDAGLNTDVIMGEMNERIEDHHSDRSNGHDIAADDLRQLTGDTAAPAITADTTRFPRN